MGYTTEFSGSFALDAPLTPEQIAYLKAFNRTRRMKRNAAITATMADPVRDAVGLPVGDDGAYFVGSQEDFGQARTADIVDYNHPPATQPALWCQWTPSDEGAFIEWDGGEKFYSYVKWIEYIIQNFLTPWGRVLNGTVEWVGESSGDLGKIVISDNAVNVLTGKVVYE